MANFGEMATVGAAVKEDCDFGKDRKGRRLTVAGRRTPGRGGRGGADRLPREVRRKVFGGGLMSTF